MRLSAVLEGRGQPVVFIHGWPGYGFDWRYVAPELADEAMVVVPDLRGFGGSERPDVPLVEGYGPTAHVGDLRALLDQRGVGDPSVVVGHDLGATVAQTWARSHPAEVAALVLCNPPYGGIGMRRFEPAVQVEAWYQHFHQLQLSVDLVARDRRSTDIYLRHFLTHWAGRPDAFTEADIEALVSTYAEPGAFEASTRWYRARAGMRVPEASASAEAPVEQPTIVLWGDADPVVRFEWSDRLGEFFTDFQLRRLPGIGHFVPSEAPDAVISAVREVVARVPRSP